MGIASWTTKVLRNKKEVLALEPPRRKTLLWHVTNRCNQSCKYCYGSFGGCSYRAQNRVWRDVPLRKLLQAADDLSSLGFERAYVCGGEPFLRDDIWPLLSRLKKDNVECFVLSNLTFIPKGFERQFARNTMTGLAFSLDSIDIEYNDWIRGNTITVMSNIREVLRMKAKYGVSTELGLYSVITKKGLRYLDPLIDWAADAGLDYVSLQLVYLPTDHPYHDQLTVTSEQREEVMAVLRHLRELGGRCRVPGDTYFELNHQLLLVGDLCAVNCFCEREPRYLFVDGNGNVRQCPCKHKQPGHLVGNIREKRLTEMEMPLGSEGIVCSELSPDCLGVWEMAHPRVGPQRH